MRLVNVYIFDKMADAQKSCFCEKIYTSERPKLLKKSYENFKLKIAFQENYIYSLRRHKLKKILQIINFKFSEHIFKYMHRLCK